MVWSVWYLRHLTGHPLREIITFAESTPAGCLFTGDLSFDVLVIYPGGYEIRRSSPATSHNRFPGMKSSCAT